MLETRRSKVRLIISLAVATVFLAFGSWLLLNRQYVIDQITVWNYQPTADIETIASEIELTGSGKFYFYVTHPQIEDAAQFNIACPQQEVGNAILGCYNGERIYLYDIEEASLAGIKQVTAAHEMLHAAWDRLSDGERESVTKLLQKEYEAIDDTKFHERMDYYERTEPGQFYNELHSIIPTEMKTISSELEGYYRRYFDDRQLIISYYDQYSSVFKSLETQSENLYGQLTALDKQIDQKRTAYTENIQSLRNDIDDFNERADSGSFSSTEAFYAERSSLVSRTNQLELDRTELNRLVDSYNDTYDKYSKVASQIQRLNSSIDSMSSAPEVPAFDN